MHEELRNFETAKICSAFLKVAILICTIKQVIWVTLMDRTHCKSLRPKNAMIIIVGTHGNYSTDAILFPGHPYIGMSRKQNGDYNASISVQSPIVHLVANSTHPKTVRSALWHCPNTTVALRLLINVARVTNLEVVRSHLPFLLQPA